MFHDFALRVEEELEWTNQPGERLAHLRDFALRVKDEENEETTLERDLHI